MREVFVERSRTGRRTGAIMLTDARGTLAGLFTDSDLARLFENHRDAALDRPIREVMTSRPRTVPQGSMMVDAVAIMAERKISELPVIDAAGRPRGLIDITDVVGLFPEAPPAGVIEQAAGTVVPMHPSGSRPTRPSLSSGAPPRDCA